ncbi:GCN5 family acetyltransferase [Methylobacterium sp. Leaf104]|uniref:GNAT family N-acetyltransferase n=1 Tax=Methylobacterium TaxID=407 RepID=UPI0006FCD731|nr:MULTISPECIES: N-acetyltransferase [Methylobacterium]KQP31832.1 GCN5 family acetyltransferase [Methylobacterium sp. Leaf104]MCI9880761.1 N-acetyltransferase [Methylobacterium goesingense]
MVQIRDEVTGDVVAREHLLDACLGEARRLKTSERLREGRLPAEGLALTAEQDGQVVGTCRLWHVEAGPRRPALLLGPLAVDPSIQGLGLGSILMRAALRRAENLGHGAVLLMGDAPYYARFGFSAGLTEGLFMPGPFERERFLGLELRRGALAGARGILRAAGAWDQPTPVPMVSDALCEAGAASRRRVA